MKNHCLSLVTLVAICIGLPEAASAAEPLSHATAAETGTPLAPTASWTITGDLHTARDNTPRRCCVMVWCHRRQPQQRLRRFPAQSCTIRHRGPGL
jgi:hypothetical protein